ncbi:MAG: 2OG-Fe(II) oxygenase [Henriciella sp.]|nr:2OG-Fe(II) oxygenase [Henriciella sp.]
MTPLIVDNIIPEAEQARIEQALFGFDMPWTLYANTNAADLKTKPGDAPQFVHGFIQDGGVLSGHAAIPTSIVEGAGLPAASILRAKANILMREPEELVHPRHIDEPNPHLVMIYYVNDADGDTCLFKGKEIVQRIAPKRGRAVFFNGATFHASSSPLKARFRCVVNLNLAPDVSLDALQR